MIATNGLLFSGLVFRDAIEGFAEVGFDAFELPHPVFYKDIFRGSAPAEVKPLCALVHDVGLGKLRLVSVNAANDFLQADERKLEDEIGRTKVVIDTASELGVGLVRVFVGEPKEGLSRTDCRELAIRGLRAVTEYASQNDKVLALENHGRYSNDFGEQMEILKAIGSNNLRLNIDTGNYYWYGYPLREAEEVMRKAIPFAAHTHFKNGVSGEKDRRREPGQNYRTVRIWQGDVDNAGFARSLRDSGYKGAYSLEEEFEGMSSMGPEQLKEAVKEDIDKLNEVLRG